MRVKTGFLISFIVFLIFVILAITVDETFFIVAFFAAFIALYVFFGVKMFKSEVEIYSKISSNSTSNEKQVKKNVEVTPVTYHSILIIAAILSLFIHNTSATTYYDWFWEDFWFQLTSSLLFVLLAVFNPYINVADKFKNRDDIPENLEFIKNERKSYIVRLVICLFLIALFIGKGWLMLPSFQGGYFVLGVNVFLILYIFRNIYVMITQPLHFFNRNTKAFLKSLIVMKGVAFVLIPLVPLTMFLLHVSGVDENNISLSPFAFIGFNALKLYFEFKVMPSI